TMGFWGGAASGAAGGFAGGFVGGTGTSWMNGANFGDGLGSGLKTGTIGGVSGGFVNGISSGITSVKHGGKFFSGKGATFNYISSDLQTGDVQVGEGMEYTSEYAENFSNRNFGEVKGVKLIADGSVAEGNFTIVGDRVYTLG